MGIQLRQSPSGKKLVGTVDGQTVVWNDTTKEWDVGTGGGAGITPISKLMVVSPVGTGTARNGAWSGSLCYTSLTEAIAAAVDGTTIVVTEALTEAPIAWADKKLFIIGYSLDEPSSHRIQLPTLQPSTTGAPWILQLEGVAAVVQPGNAGICIGQNCVIDAQGASGSTYIMQGSPESCSFGTSLGGLACSGLTARGCTLSATTVNAQALLQNCKVLGNLNIGLGATITETDGGGFSITFPANKTLTIDVQSLKTVGTIVGAPTIVLSSEQAAPDLQRVVYWDAATAVPLSHQNGSRNAPYSVLQTAINAAGPTNGTVIVMGLGDGTQTFTFDGATANHNLNVQAFEGANPQLGLPAIGDVTLQNHAHVTFQGLHTGTITISDCRLWYINCIISSFQATGQTSLLGYAVQASATANNSFPYVIGNSHYTAAAGSTFTFYGYYLSGNHVCDGVAVDYTFQQCGFVGPSGGGGLFLLTAGITAYVDQWTMSFARRSGYDLTTHIVGGAKLQLSDRPINLGVVFAVGALAAAFADVTVALAGTKPGDTFDIAPNPAAILANVAPVAAWCAVAGNITVRFFGTTAGGNYQLDININENSGA